MHVIIKDGIATRGVCVPHSNVRSAYSEGEQTEGAYIQHGGEGRVQGHAPPEIFE